jgi:hypothetical protein
MSRGGRFGKYGEHKRFERLRRQRLQKIETGSLKKDFKNLPSRDPAFDLRWYGRRSSIPNESSTSESLSQRFDIERVVSGGQTGVDRAALDVALELGIPCGGWCPKGRRAEDGPIDARYPLRETRSSEYRVRTGKNVVGSDGTLVLAFGPLKGGTALTVRLAQKHRRPFLVVDLSHGGDSRAVEDWIRTNRIRILNVAGPRETESPGIYERAREFLEGVFKK